MLIELSHVGKEYQILYSIKIRIKTCLPNHEYADIC